MPKAAKPVKTTKAPKPQKQVAAPSAKQAAVVVSKGASSGVVAEYNELVGQGLITPQGGAEPILVTFNCLVPGPDKKYPVLYPGDEVEFEVEDRKARRNLLGEEFGPGKIAVNVKLVKAVPRQATYHRRHVYLQ